MLCKYMSANATSQSQTSKTLTGTELFDWLKEMVLPFMLCLQKVKVILKRIHFSSNMCFTSDRFLSGRHLKAWNGLIFYSVNIVKCLRKICSYFLDKTEESCLNGNEQHHHSYHILYTNIGIYSATFLLCSDYHFICLCFSTINHHSYSHIHLEHDV